MNQSEKDLINHIENMFENNYNHLEYTKKELKKLGVSDTIANAFVVRIESSQNMLFETCGAVNDLVGIMTSKSDTNPRRFNIFDKDFEEQVKEAEKELREQYKGTYNEEENLAFNSSFNSGRIESFDLYNQSIEELLSKISNQIDQSDDQDGGTFYVVSK